ncbi:MAG TPA: TetR/AcrR family transcriptional regulator [Novosphingobium sp.]|nr:TetR/AcrR family transcriptional regulator [Novosphingobium sp.]
MMVRLTRSQSQAQTRERLIASARALFSREGFAATSVERIAEEAGYSKGAVYSNFGGKEQIFLAALHAEGGEHMAALLGPLSQVASAKAAIDLLANWANACAASGNWPLTLLEYAWQVQGDDASLQRQQAILRAYWQQLGACLIARFPDVGCDPQTIGALLFELAYAPALSPLREPTPGSLVRLVLEKWLI